MAFLTPLQFQGLIGVALARQTYEELFTPDGKPKPIEALIKVPAIRDYVMEIAPPMALLTLIRARAKIESGWVQGSYRARRKFRFFGPLVSTSDPAKATHFCAFGALIAAEPDQNLRLDALAYLHKHVPDIIAFNDAKGRTKDEVLAVFDRAIQQLEGAT